ncbi:MAG: Na/Pi cotransporter family protein, partial [Gammaproteobacteria bacterium]|nr:Na/Pi cotransporter family protein [Gammaproteobacteria bacterium]
MSLVYAGLFTLLGGIGLFLLGMRLMTDGLTASAGGGLRTILAGATRSRGRALVSGLIITTGVQSSSAVIFATIGFVNAGLLSLGQSVGLVYGANLGTTLTSWLVAVAGFNLHLRALALPAIGLGALAWAISRSSRWGALGQAVAGFGLFFLGIDVLREAFDGIGGMFSVQGQDAETIAGIAAFVLSGIAITLLTQSSSATLAITLTAAAGGLLPLQAAAAMIIGANVGTTSTAVFAAIGATSPARRVAAAHVLFNVVTAAMALALLPALLWLSRAMAGVVMDEPHIALVLAVFHT